MNNIQLEEAVYKGIRKLLAGLGENHFTILKKQIFTPHFLMT